MICYKCGCRLSEYDFCTGCGADVSLYKKVLSMSNLFYNDGLEKAAVRDLSGAIVSLRQSIKLNKNNIEARNLLGLVYFEMGEVVSALREWVLSKNLRPKKNIADDYIAMIQSNQTRLDSINQTIKKYNQALAYCSQDSRDLAIIQLKKVLSNNPKYLMAHQLLALLYISMEEWEKAKRELVKCIQIDKGNTITLRYMSEVDHMLMPETGNKSSQKRKDSSGEILRYKSGNEMIIQPMNGKEKKGVSSLLNLGIGLIIGIAIARFLILPARIQSAQAEVNNDLRTVGEQLDAKTAAIDEMEQEIQRLKSSNQELQEELQAYEETDGALQVTDSLMMAVNAYLTSPEDLAAIAGYMELLEAESKEDKEERTETFETLYEAFLLRISQPLSVYYYDTGYASYRIEDYAQAAPNLERAYKYNETNGDALFYFGNSCRMLGDTDRAKEVYAKVIDDFPGTLKAAHASTYLAEINNSSN